MIKNKFFTLCHAVIGIPFLICLLFTSGCAVQKTNIYTEDKDRTLVYGNITVSKKISGSLLYGFVFSQNCGLTVLDVKKSEIIGNYPIENLGGYFFWYLPPGKYAILDLTCRSENFLGDKKGKEVRIYSEFLVNDKEPIYIGHMHLDFSDDSMKTSIIDNYDDSKKVLIEKYPELEKLPVKKLMKREEDLI